MVLHDGNIFSYGSIEWHFLATNQFNSRLQSFLGINSTELKAEVTSEDVVYNQLTPQAEDIGAVQNRPIIQLA